MLFLALTWSWTAQADDLTVCDGTEENSNVPFYGLYADTQGTTSECIIPADLLGDMVGGQISSMKFYIKTPADAAWTGTHQVYVGEVDATTLTALSGPSAYTIVCTASFDATGSELLVTFDDPYTYSGGNLLIGTYVSVKGNWKSAYFYGVSAPSGSGRYNSGTGSGTAVSFLPKTTFEYTPAGSGPVCDKPETLEVSDVTAHEANLAWTGTVGAYDVEYKKASDEEWTVALQTSSETSLTLDNLEPLTSYSVRVRSVCGSEDFSGYKTASFTTQAGIPLVEPFATANLPENWSKYTGLLSDVMAGSATLSSGGSWFFGTSNGVFDSHARVNVYGTGCKYWLVAPALLMEDNVQLTFDLALTAYSGDLAAPATSGTDDKFVVLLSADNGATWTILRQWDNAGSDDVFNNIPNTAAGQQVAIDLSSYNGQNICIAFYGESTVSNADNNLHIDNVRIDYIPDCAIPTTLAVSEITAHTAQLSWTDDAASEWVIAYKKAADTDFTEIEGVTENPYTLEGLVGETAYEVKIKANCGDAQSEFTASKNFTTLIACQKPTALAAQITPGNGSIATLSWTAGGEETEWIIEYCTNNTFEGDDLVEVTGITENPFILDNLTAETTYFARVKANCGDEDGVSKWSNVVSFTPTDAFFLTVNDGTATNDVVPIYGYWCDNATGIRSQFIIPAADLATIQWGTINKLTFHASTGNASWGDAEFEVYMAETSETTISALADFDAMEKVMNAGSLSISGNKMVVTLDAPYQYMGGNLMIGFKQTAQGNYTSCTWYGVSAESGSSFGGYNTSLSAKSFLPKVSFDYTPGEEPQCVKPTGLAVEYNGGTEATISWTSDASSFNMRVNGTPIDAAINSPSYVLGGLELATTYSIEVQANCGIATSDWTSPVSFTTDLCLPADMCAINYSLTDQYNDSWNGASIKVKDNVTNEIIETITMPSGTGPYIGSFTVCDGRAIQFVWSAGSYDSECGYTFTDVSGDEIFSGSGAMSAPVDYTVDCPSCFKPKELAASNIASSTADLSWTAGASETQWVLQYSEDAEFANPASETINDNPSFQLTGLEPEHTYYVRVKAVCGSDDESDWAVLGDAFSTLAACPTPFDLEVVGAIPYNDTIAWTGSSDVQSYNVEYRIPEHVDGISESFNTNSIPAGWAMYTGLLDAQAGTATLTSASYGWSFGANNGVFDSHARVNIYSNYQRWLVSPEFVVGNDAQLSFDLALTAYSGENVPAPQTTGTDDKFIVLISANDMSSWTVLRQWDNAGSTYVYNDIANTADGENVKIDLSAYQNQSVRIAFYGESTVSNADNNLHIDNVSCGELVPAGAWQPETVSETSIVLSGLEPSKPYEVRVKSECAGDEGWSDTLSFVAEAKEFVTITAAGYATYYNSFAYSMPAGVEGYAFTSGLVLSKAFDPTDEVAYETPLVLKGNQGKYEIVPTAAAGSQPIDNLLIGEHAQKWISSETGKLFYVLSLAKPEGDADPDPSTVGFYWYKSDGSGGFSLPAKKAYLKLDASDANNAPGFIFDENGATSLDNLKGVEGTLKFIQDGTIYILREGVIYDATGRKVSEF